MEQVVSKSQFKPRALHYFREVQEKGIELTITDRGKPVIRIIPFVEKPEEALAALRNSVIKYEDPTEPVDFEEREVLK